MKLKPYKLNVKVKTAENLYIIGFHGVQLASHHLDAFKLLPANSKEISEILSDDFDTETFFVDFYEMVESHINKRLSNYLDGLTSGTNYLMGATQIEHKYSEEHATHSKIRNYSRHLNETIKMKLGLLTSSSKLYLQLKGKVQLKKQIDTSHLKPHKGSGGL